MQQAPKGIRLHIGLFGRTNVGKSSFLNMISGQDVAITSPIPGTTTDVVEKAMELLPLGPVVFLDTAGINDVSALSEKRVEKTRKVFTRADIVVLLIEPDIWTEYEDMVCREARERQAPLIIVVNKVDQKMPTEDFLNGIKIFSDQVVLCSSIDQKNRNGYVGLFKERLIKKCPDSFLSSPAIVGDLIPAGGLAVLVVPIDLEAPKGRLILPQVQTIRDVLDNDAAVIVVKEREYVSIYQFVNRKPDIVVCDSQVVQKMVADTPDDVKCTTFSILFARYKSDLIEAAKGAAALNYLKDGDKVLIAEACSHHAIEDDIGRVKIPRWLRQYTGLDLTIDVVSGHDYPDDLSQYKVVVHCGSCMLTRRETLFRYLQARQAGVAVTNYGVCISLLQGVLKRVLEPFPAALSAYEKANTKH
ncbi:MAG: [FeFe] hydrogenase H-cluster maturation GTPase HydF [Candidatus Omnitrophota bacterium]